MRFYIALWFSKLLIIYINLFHKNRGTNAPGRIALKIDPLFVKHIRGIDTDKVVFLTGTNGKSTTTTITSHILSQSGKRVCTNKDGANMLSGVATELIKDCSILGTTKSDYFVMETDERYLPLIYKQISAKYIVVVNIQKDQAQRNGEPSFIFDKLAGVLNDNTTVFVNRDDPRSFILKDYVKEAISFGVQENSHSYHKEDDFFAVSLPCPKCSNPIHFDAHNIENIGPFHCVHCDYESGEAADYLIEKIDYSNKKFEAQSHVFDFNFNTPYFAYCYISAIAVAHTMGIEYKQIQDAVSTFDQINHRVDSLCTHGKELRYIKMKQENSETIQSCINLISEDDSEKSLMIAFDEQLDFFPPYIIGFYLFDCDLRSLNNQLLSNWICFSPFMAQTVALRFLYDGFDTNRMMLGKDSNDKESVFKMIEQTSANRIYLVDEIPFYNPRGEG